MAVPATEGDENWERPQTWCTHSCVPRPGLLGTRLVVAATNVSARLRTRQTESLRHVTRRDFQGSRSRPYRPPKVMKIARDRLLTRAAQYAPLAGTTRPLTEPRPEGAVDFVRGAPTLRSSAVIRGSVPSRSRGIPALPRGCRIGRPASRRGRLAEVGFAGESRG